MAFQIRPNKKREREQDNPFSAFPDREDRRCNQGQ